MSSLKPCPFCGGEAYQKTAYPCDPDGLEMNLFIVGCKNCDIEFSQLWNEKAVIEAWNTRKPMEAVVAELEKRAQLYRKYNNYEGERGVKTAIEIVRNGGKE